MAPRSASSTRLRRKTRRCRCKRTAARRGPTRSHPPGKQGPMHLADPWWLLLAVLVPFVVRAARRPFRRATIRYPSLGLLRTIAPRGAGSRRLVLLALRAGALVAIALALARPQAGSA